MRTVPRVLCVRLCGGASLQRCTGSSGKDENFLQPTCSLSICWNSFKDRHLCRMCTSAFLDLVKIDEGSDPSWHLWLGIWCPIIFRHSDWSKILHYRATDILLSWVWFTSMAHQGQIDIPKINGKSSQGTSVFWIVEYCFCLAAPSSWWYFTHHLSNENFSTSISFLPTETY